VSKAKPTTAWAAWGESDRGRVRENNEDRIFCDPERGIFVVVDGMGGEAAGEEAAQRALASIQERLARDTGTVPRRIREAITAGNNEIHRLSQTRADWRGMACVLTVAVIDEATVHVGHVGDTRLYVVRRGRIQKATPDHSPIGKREDRGELSELEAMRHPRRNEVYRDVGSEPHKPDDRDFIEYLHFPFEPDSALVLCSDGLSDMLTSAQILRALEAHAGNPQRSARELVRLANEAGGKDNVSAIVVEGEEFAEGVRAGPGSEPGEVGQPAVYAGETSGPGTGGLIRALVGPWPMFLYGALLAWLAFTRFGGRPPRVPGGVEPTEQTPAPRQPLVVEPGSARFPTIGKALEAAVAGDRIEIVPGEYNEAIQLKEDVTLAARSPGEVVLAFGHAAPGQAVVTAEGIRNARLSGFVVRGAAGGASPGVGVGVWGWNIGLCELVVWGATRAGVWIDGDSRPTLIGGHIHSNAGSGVVIAGTAAPRLVGNVIERNGRAAGKPRPGVDVTGGGVPDLVRNLIAENGAEGIRVRKAELRDRFVANFFGSAERRNRGGNVGVARE
jgi:serine/threonine protein phosphatase PrpC